MQIVNLAEYDKLEKIGNGAFYDCDSLKEITFPKSITTLGEEFFSGCKKVETVDLSECTKLEVIGNNAFSGWDSLKKVIFPKSIISIRKNAFRGCKQLVKTNLSECDKLEKIGDGAFRDCESLNDSFLASYFKRKEEKKIEEKRLKEEKLEAERKLKAEEESDKAAKIGGLILILLLLFGILYLISHS